MKKIKLLIEALTLILFIMIATSNQSDADALHFQMDTSTIPSTNLSGQQKGVTMAMIPEFQEKPAIELSIQPIPLHTANLINFIDKGNEVAAADVVKFSHPDFTTEEINNTPGTFDESLSYLKNQGLVFTKVAGIPDWKLIIDELNSKRPVLAHLKATSSYWLEPESAVIIWGIQVFEFEGQPTNVLYFARSLNHADNPIYSGMESDYDLLTNEKMQDPSLKVMYSWIDTAYGFKK